MKKKIKKFVFRKSTVYLLTAATMGNLQTGAPAKTHPVVSCIKICPSAITLCAPD